MSEPPSLNDLVNDRSDIHGLRDQLKTLAQQRRDQGDDVTIDDMLAMSTKNDPLYVQPADLEKAEWFADIYQQEGEPEIHPRGVHYQILGKGYETWHGEAYGNSDECWQDLKEAVKWTRILGLVNNTRIQNQKNATPLSPRSRVFAIVAEGVIVFVAAAFGVTKWWLGREVIRGL